MGIPRTIGLLALMACGPAEAQGLTSDCTFDELRGPVAAVELHRARYEGQPDQRVLGDTSLRGRDEFDTSCNYTSRVLYDHSVVHWEYWPDEEGRGRRLRSWSVPRAGSSPPPPAPAPRASGSAGVPEQDRGTRIEYAASPDSMQVFEREISNGVLKKDWTHTLDAERRVIRSFMLDGAGQPRYRIEREYVGREVVSSYAWIPTREYPSSNSSRRERTVDEEVDAHGNWTRRAVYEWTAAGQWEPKEVLTRAITYR